MYLDFDNAKPNDVAAFGRATIDLYANEIGPMEDAVTFSKYVGGSPANTAIAMARLGLRVGYVGKVSDDQFGRFITRHLGENGVDVSHIAIAAPGIRSGVTMGEIRPDGCSCFMYRSDCADLHIDCAQLDEDYIASHKLLLVSGTSLSHSPAREAVFLAIEYARRNGVRVSFDLDYREGTWNSPEEASVYFTLAARQADMVLGTREEFDMMERVYHPGNRSDAQSAQWLLDAGVRVVSIKQGKRVPLSTRRTAAAQAESTPPRCSRPSAQEIPTLLPSPMHCSRAGTCPTRCNMPRRPPRSPFPGTAARTPCLLLLRWKTTWLHMSMCCRKPI